MDLRQLDAARTRQVLDVDHVDRSDAKVGFQQLDAIAPGINLDARAKRERGDLVHAVPLELGGVLHQLGHPELVDAFDHAVSQVRSK